MEKMMKNVSNGFRKLDASEIAAVAGGTIVVVGNPWERGGGGFPGAGGGAGNGIENPEQGSDHLQLTPEGGGGGGFPQDPNDEITVLVDATIEREGDNLEIELEVIEGVTVETSFDLDDFNIEEIGVTLNNGQQNFDVNFDFNDLEFGVSNTLDFGGGITGDIRLSLSNSGGITVTFSASF